VGSLKKWARIDADNDEQNALLSDLITLSSQWISTYTGKAVMESTYTWRIDGFRSSDSVLLLPNPPTTSVSSVRYKQQSDGALTAFTDFETDLESHPARIYPAYGYTWPLTRRTPNAVEVVYVSGYEDRSDLPRELRMGILMLATYLYENPDEGSGNFQESRGMPTLLKQILGPQTLLEVY
tara:strand:- start:10 stop:552 length:543 start_codon:yes stop_codon:yes gene_type:complete